MGRELLKLNIPISSEDATIALSGNIGHLPILKNDRVVGILTRSDYLCYKALI